MPVSVVNTAVTTQLKVGSGYIRQIMGVSAGTGFAYKLNDGPVGPTNSVNTIFGSGTAIPVVAGGVVAFPNLLFFPNGIQIVSSGTPGEFEVDWY